MLKKSFITALLLLIFSVLRAQDGTSAFQFLKLPFLPMHQHWVEKTFLL